MANTQKQVQHCTQAPQLEFHELPDDEIGVTFKYDEAVKEDLKVQFPPSKGRTWDPDAKMWRFPADLYEEVKAWALIHYDETEIRFPGQAGCLPFLCTLHPQSCRQHRAQIPVSLLQNAYPIAQDGCVAVCFFQCQRGG